MSTTTRVVLGLLAGLGFGLLIHRTDAAPELARWIEPIGTIWVNAIRMTLVPLIVSLLFVGIADASDAKRLGAIGVRALIMFLAMLSIVALVVAVLAPALYSFLHIDPASTQALRATAAPLPPAISASANARDFFLNLIPVNPIKAAADGALLPVMVFTVLFALALSKMRLDSRETLNQFFRAVRDATFVLIGWILALAPIGVFALGFATAVRIGGTAFGAIGYYIGLVIALHLVTGIALYVLAVFVGRVPLRVFAHSVAPAQAVALSSRSSLASLPALIQGARDILKLPADIVSFVLPLAVAIFKLTSPIYWTMGALLVARLYGIDLGVSGIAIVAVSSVVMNAATPGIPSGGLLIQAPVYQAAGLPVEGIALLIAIDAIPDMFKTAFNVTADMAVAVVVTRWTQPLTKEET